MVTVHPLRKVGRGTIKRSLILCATSLFLALQPPLFAEELGELTDQFYSGLAQVIENNMHAPGEAVRAVDAYYAMHEREAQKIREKMEVPMREASELMDKYQSMNAAELEAWKRSESGHVRRRQESSAQTLYGEALMAFSERYPIEGAKIASKAMALLPDMSAQFARQFEDY